MSINNFVAQLKVLSQVDPLFPQDVQKGALKLENLVLKKHSFDADEILALLLKKTLTRLQSLYGLFEVNLEIEFAEAIVDGSVKDYSKYLLYDRFIGLIKNEIDLAEIKEKDKVLFIGSGPFPVTAILLNKLAGCRVDCFEKYFSRTRLSQEVFSRFGLSQNIRVFNTVGEKLQKNSYDVVVVALLAKPKKKILVAIKKFSRANVRVICRTSDGLRQVFYETTEPEALDGLGSFRKC